MLRIINFIVSEKDLDESILITKYALSKSKCILRHWTFFGNFTYFDYVQFFLEV